MQRRGGSGPRRIVVGVDGSLGSAQALRWAYDETDRRHNALTVVTAWSPPDRSRAGAPASGEWLARAVATAAVDDVLGPAGRHVKVWVPERPASASSVLRWASRRADVLVLGRGPRLTLEHCEPISRSTTWRVLAGVACPTVVVGVQPAVRWARVVVGLDGSVAGQNALVWGRAEALRTGAELVTLRAPAGSDALAVLLAAAATADLLVVGRPRAPVRSGGPGLLGTGLLRRSPCPVVMVPPPRLVRAPATRSTCSATV